MPERKSLADDIQLPERTTQAPAASSDSKKLTFAVIALVVGIAGMAYSFGWFDGLFNRSEIKKQMQQPVPTADLEEQRQREKAKQTLPESSPQRAVTTGAN